MTMHTNVAVIGSGFSAAALSLNLVELLPPTAKIHLVGAQDKYGRGIAYGTLTDCHLLNVPAGRMSLFSDRPNHFVEWLAESGHVATGDDFVPRRLYGMYIVDCLDAALKRTANRAALTLVDAEAHGAEALQNGGLMFRLSDGTRLSADFAALCTGAGTGRLPLGEDRLPADVVPFVVHDPWFDDWPERLPGNGDVLFVGTGLTMVDQCLLLKRRGFRGTIQAVSRHGLLPQAHLAKRADPVDAVLAPGSGDVSEMLARLRARAASVTDWRAVMDGLRPVTQSLWSNWSATQRSRFLRHAAAFWNVHRHRMAPGVAAEIEALRRSGQLIIHKGRLEALRPAKGRVAADIKTRDRVTIAADLVINCTGFERCTIEASPLLTNLAEQGMIRPAPCGLGLDVSKQSMLLDADGTDNPRLYALGAITAGRHWEITAVPDIRVQARSVADHINRQVCAG